MSLLKKITQNQSEGEPKPQTKEKTKKAEPKKKVEVSEEKDKWFQSEGKITIDLYKEDGDIVIVSTIAGITTDDLEITIQGDMIGIKGVRPNPDDKDKDKTYYHQECYWGPFSRQIILPEEIDPSKAEASLKEGILTIRVPALEREKKRKLEVK